jgi:hypothetical protein
MMIGLAGLGSIRNVWGTSCENLCESLEECANDPHEHGSYCKSWETPKTCFGLYWRDEGKTEMCFEPNSEDCPESIPVECPSVVPPVNVCEVTCASTEGCLNDPHAHGSYCKKWQDPPVCFGLYYMDSSRTETCFQPTDGDACPETLPVTCENWAEDYDEEEATTTRNPEVTTTGARAVRAVVSLRTTIAATSTTTTSIPQPRGRYAGVGGPSGILSLEATLRPERMTVDVVFGLGPARFPKNDMPYTFDGSRVYISPVPESIEYLRRLPAPQTPDTVVITYDAVADTLRASFNGIVIVGTKQ